MVRRSPAASHAVRAAHMSAEDPSTSIFEWTPPSAGVPRPVPHRRLPRRGRGAPADDRGAAADDLVRRLARTVRDWLEGRRAPARGVHARLVEEPKRSSRPNASTRPAMNLWPYLARVAGNVADDGGPALREALAAECDLWLGAGDGRPCSGTRPAWPRRCSRASRPWARGDHPRPRLVRDRRARHRVRPGPRSAAVRDRLRGRPRSRRPAPRPPASSPAAWPTRFVYDAALVAAAEPRRPDLARQRGDRPGGLRGAHRDPRSARARPAPRRPRRDPRDHGQARGGGPLRLPEWPAEEAWLLWEGAPTDVVVESMSFEQVPLDLVDALATERGLASPVQKTVVG